jgi:hypothetical protein
MPLMMVWADSSSRWTRKVGSSRVNRLSALEKLACPVRSFGATARSITASGTCIEVMVTDSRPSVKVSPEAHSTPNSATMSPALASPTSIISLLCIRTMRGIFTFSGSTG